jgi:hypothetical protein
MVVSKAHAMFRGRSVTPRRAWRASQDTGFDLVIDSSKVVVWPTDPESIAGRERTGSGQISFGLLLPGLAWTKNKTSLRLDERGGEKNESCNERAD